MIVNSKDNLTPLVILAFTGAALSLGCPIVDLNKLLLHMGKNTIPDTPSGICVRIIDAMSDLGIQPCFSVKA